MAAALGCFAVLLLIGVGARRFVSPVTTLVFGLMISYAVSAVVTVLQSSATAEALQTYVFWGMGTFGKASFIQVMFCLTLQVLLGIWMIVVPSGWTCGHLVRIWPKRWASPRPACTWRFCC